MRSHSSFIGFLNNVISGAHLAFSCYESLVPLDPRVTSFLGFHDLNNFEDYRPLNL